MNLRIYYCFHFIILELHWKSTTGNDTDDDVAVVLAPSHPVQITSYRQILPTDPLSQLRRKYKLEDFLAVGSGDGPSSSDQEGGLAWVDNGGGVKDDLGQFPSVILVTKTMVLLRTVMTTVYPLELTPIVVPASPSVSVTTTPYLPEHSPTPSVTTVSTVSTTIIEPTSTFSIPIGPSATPTPPSSPVTETEEMPTASPDTLAASANSLYLINTVIKTNNASAVLPDPQFQEKMGQNLAKVYASAFTRHLLSSLGIWNKTAEKGASLRRRRNVEFTQSREREEVDYEWLFAYNGDSSAQLKALATAAMNVSVSIVNATVYEAEPGISMDYFVLAEGKPVTGASAVQDIKLVTIPEMEELIKYKLIKKAEAHQSPSPPPQPPVEKSAISDARTSTWLVIGVTLILLMVAIILLLGIVAWKWKQKRIVDRELEIDRQTPSSLGIEHGVINPAFISPKSRSHLAESYREQELQPGSSKQKPQGQGHGQGHGQGKQSNVNFAADRSEYERKSQQKSLAKELSQKLAFDESVQGQYTHARRGSPSSVDKDYYTEGLSSSCSEESFQEASSIVIKPRDVQGQEGRPKNGRSFIVKEPSPRKRAKTAVRRKVEHKEAGAEGQASARPLSASSREKVTFGHLDLCDDSVAKPISNEAKKLMPSRQPSAKPRGVRPLTAKTEPQFKDVSREEPISEGGSAAEDDRNSASNFSVWDQDRELGESFDTNAGPPPVSLLDSPKKDAQVQTPVRLRGVLKPRKPKAKPRRFNSTATKKSAESLISTESEEIIEIHGLDESGSETNTLGKMRKRFHQFLDDAFNVIGKKEDSDESRTKSAKVSLTHQIETKEMSRPWTSSNIIREETFESPRPKSASIGAPKRAWTASTEKRCHSAKSHTSAKSRSGGQGPSRISRAGAEMVMEERIVSDDEPDQNSSSVIHTPSSDGNRSYVSSIAPLFPRYPIYPDIPYPAADPDPERLPPEGETGRDPAVPLIAAIKEEIKRFERLKVTENQPEVRSRWST